MQITRTINDKEYTFELTPLELEAAFREREFSYRISDAAYYFERYLRSACNELDKMEQADFEDALYADDGIAPELDEIIATRWGVTLSQILPGGVEAFLYELAVRRYEEEDLVGHTEVAAWDYATEQLFSAHLKTALVKMLVEEQLERKFSWVRSADESDVREFDTLRSFINAMPELLQEMHLALRRVGEDIYIVTSRGLDSPFCTQLDAYDAISPVQFEKDAYIFFNEDGSERLRLNAHDTMTPVGLLVRLNRAVNARA